MKQRKNGKRKISILIQIHALRKSTFGKQTRFFAHTGFEYESLKKERRVENRPESKVGRIRREKHSQSTARRSPPSPHPYDPPTLATCSPVVRTALTLPPVGIDTSPSKWHPFLAMSPHTLNAPRSLTLPHKFQPLFTDASRAYIFFRDLRAYLFRDLHRKVNQEKKLDSRHIKTHRAQIITKKNALQIRSTQGS